MFAPERDVTAETDDRLVEAKPLDLTDAKARWDELCSRRGSRKPGWVWHRYTAMLGQPPPRGFVVPLSAAELAEEEARLRQIAQERGYKPGWIHYQLAGRTGQA